MTLSEQLVSLDVRKGLQTVTSLKGLSAPRSRPLTTNQSCGRGQPEAMFRC